MEATKTQQAGERTQKTDLETLAELEREVTRWRSESQDRADKSVSDKNMLTEAFAVGERTAYSQVLGLIAALQVVAGKTVPFSEWQTRLLVEEVDKNDRMF